MDSILLGFSSGIFIAYVIYIWLKFGILSSISDSYYKTNSPFLFAIFIWGTAIPLIIVGNTALMFFAGALLCFVGASPAFKKRKMEEKIHVYGTIGSIALGIISMWVDFGLWYLTVIMVAGYIFTMFVKIKNETWYVEILAFVLVMLGLLIK